MEKTRKQLVEVNQTYFICETCKKDCNAEYFVIKQYIEKTSVDYHFCCYECLTNFVLLHQKR
jgi:hypothetical protein